LKRITKKIENRLKENALKSKVETTFKELLIKLLKDDRKILVYHDL
jgi:ribosomal protein S20